MFSQNEKVAVFIDGANLYATAKSLDFDSTADIRVPTRDAGKNDEATNERRVLERTVHDHVGVGLGDRCGRKEREKC